jgi:hypothetical protein
MMPKNDYGNYQPGIRKTIVKMNDAASQLVLDFSISYRKGQITSQAADVEANATFKARHCQLTYMAVRNYKNGGTAREIAKAGQDNGIKITHDIVWRRLHDLKDNEYLRNGERRKCKISKRLCKTWWII